MDDQVTSRTAVSNSTTRTQAASGDGDRPQRPDDVWDTESWSGPEQLLLMIVALVAPIVLWVAVVDHIPEAWVDLAALPILGLGDMVAAALFVFVYGSTRALVKPWLTRSAVPPRTGKHRR